ncbi:molybdopterin molybdotransferase MoeA [Sphingomonas sp. PL-96]|uniref:molybdopterin molybdotransferase MoeA n=1 Tax=Sphingomonas sp. PL-96 TaxID=2887201 RepID=UPI001E4F241E|nr:molybdopterin molybdotransferase MoeA [Sphingomonas sp. PL-96]MCC2976457.1 molybdopterin molybdotransferase MoeA [Sphingomonas sp. PL-96]
MSLLPLDEAQARVFALATPVPVETVPIVEAIGRWAAGDLAALRTQPDRALSSMDGYAIRFADLPGPWEVIGESAAGRPFAGSLRTGQATRIFTGAALPDGADTVLVQEEASRDGARLLLTGEGPPRLGSSVRAAGLDFMAGDPLVAQGAAITPAVAALLAVGGHGGIPVRRRVRVAIAATGDELVPAGSPPEAGLPESNGVMLAGLLARLPVERIDLGILPDDRGVLAAAFAAVDADVLVTTGGASVGDHDLVRPALETAGATIDFWRIAMRPGKPMMAGRLRDAVVLGLPGNPVSAFVTATLFLLPLVRKLAGAADPLARRRVVPLGAPLAANDRRADHLRAELRDGIAFPAPAQDSSMLRTLAHADCLIVRPPHAPAANVGDSVEILDIG